ncbi:MAG: trigger factor [Anaerolinea sp.]|nr:trigger factor [Anaerolinea sp.]
MTTLKIETQARDDHQMKVTAEFETSALDNYKRQAARKIAQKGKIPGFRPGKAPYDVIVRLYGEPAIEEEAVEIMVEDVYPQILTEAKIEPSGPGSLQDISKKDPLKFTFVVPLEPTVDLAGYRELRKKYALKSVTNKQVDEFVERLKKSYATAEPVERPAKDGDLVYLKVDATLLNPAEDDKPELLKDSPLQVVIGEKDPGQNDFPYAGFGDNLVKLAANDEKTFIYTYPVDSKYEKLRSKEVEFHVTVQSVKVMHLPELDDAFAQTLGEFENVEKLRDSIKLQLENREKEEYEQMYYDELLEKLIAQAKIKYPPHMLEHEMEHVVESVKEDLTKQRMELDIYLKTIKKENAAWLEEEIKPIAIKRLERSLVLDEIAKVEKIQVKNEELQTEFTSMISEMQRTADFKKLEKQLKNERVANAFAMQAATRLLNRQVLERLKDIATGKAEEIVAAPESEKTETITRTASKKKTETKVEVTSETIAAPVKAKKSSKNSFEEKAH